MAEPSEIVWELATRRIRLDHPVIMGVVNVTPDSFSDGGRYLSTQAAIDHGLGLARAGADLVDVGGESTRPGADPVDAEEEMSRVVPVVQALASAGVVVSVDTAKPRVALAAMEAGAEVINDVTAAAEPEMVAVMARTGAGVVLMHMQGTPRTMQHNPTYDDVVTEVCEFLVERARVAERGGVGRQAIMIDPGIGFGKTTRHNLILLDRLGVLVATGFPVLVGASRKAFLGQLAGIPEPELRDVATAASTALVVARGAAGVRVHDVVSSRHAAGIGWALARVDSSEPS